MVSLRDLSPDFVNLLVQEFPFVQSVEYMRAFSPHRWLDLVEMYSGQGHLSKSVEQVTRQHFFKERICNPMHASCETT